MGVANRQWALLGLVFLGLGVAFLVGQTVRRTVDPKGVEIQWDEKRALQSSEDLENWSDVPNAVSPVPANVDDKPRQFFRLKPNEAADTILRDANIYTVDETFPTATVLAIKDGRIVYLGEELPSGVIGEDTEVIEAGGRLVLPGFHDVHLHALEAGINERTTIFPQFGSASGYRRALQDAADASEDSEWVFGAGVNMAALVETLDSPLALIDEIISDRPALVIDDLGHGAWANSLALAAVGFDRMTTDPPGGILDRDPANGRLTGVVFENAAQTLIDAAQPPTEQNLELAYQQFLGVLDLLAENGITSVSDAGGYWPRGHHQVWLRALEEETLTVRANNAFYVYPDKTLESQLNTLRDLRRNELGSLLRFNQVKIYVDGILSQTTAALVDPYETDVETFPGGERGFQYFGRSLNSVVTAFDAVGYQLHFHATGDLGTRLALDAIAAAQASNGSQNRGHRITHVYMVHPDDVRRFGELQVWADFQLAPSSLTRQNLEEVEFLIGERAQRYLPAKTVLEAGAPMTLSSDYDADELSPFVKIETVLRREQQGLPDVQTAIRLLTLEPAKLLLHEEITGSLRVGKAADLILLDQDLFTVPINRISDTQVLLTMLAGKTVYRDPEL